MNYIYHGVPENMIGDTLTPLTQMHSVNPTLEQIYLEKYKGREEILDRRVPLLNCLWNDVLQFLPMHPRKVFELQLELGIISSVPPNKFYEIDPSELDPAKTAVFFKDKPGDETVTVKWLKDVDLSLIQDIPQATKNYYTSVIGTGELPFNYQFIPHILYKGTVTVSESQIISL